MALSGHDFNLTTKSCEQVAYNFAIVQARKCSEQNYPDKRIQGLFERCKQNNGIYAAAAGSVSRILAKQAYEQFKEDLKSQCPDAENATLLQLTIESREHKFLYKLPQAIEDILITLQTSEPDDL